MVRAQQGAEGEEGAAVGGGSGSGNGSNMDSPRQGQNQDPLYQLFCSIAPNEGTEQFLRISDVMEPWVYFRSLFFYGGPACIS